MQNISFCLLRRFAYCAVILISIILVGCVADQHAQAPQTRAHAQKKPFAVQGSTDSSEQQTSYTFSEEIAPIPINRISKKFDTYYRRRVAVCVGINKYTEKPLNSAVNDAKAMAGIFKGYGFDEIYLLTDERATKQKIVNELLRFKGEAHEKDLFVLYFAGHGATLVNAQGEDEGFLISVDTQKDNIYETGISMGLFKDIAETMPNKHMLFLVDCCYAGYGLTRGNIVQKDQRKAQSMIVEDYRPPRNITHYLNQSLAAPAVQILTAGGKGEEALESLNHGLFTGRVINVLKGETSHGRDGLITAAELAHFIRQTVSRDSEGLQNPVYGYLKGNGDVLFVTGQQEGRKIEKKRILTLAEIDVLYKKAHKLRDKGEYLKADLNISKAYNHIKRYKNVSREVMLDYLKKLSLIAIAMQKNDMVIYYAQEILLATDNELEAVLAYGYLGKAYKDKGDYNRAIEYCVLSVSQREIPSPG